MPVPASIEATQSRPSEYRDSSRIDALPGSSYSSPATAPANGTVAPSRTRRSSTTQVPSGRAVEKCATRSPPEIATAAGRVADVALPEQPGQFPERPVTHLPDAAAAHQQPHTVPAQPAGLRRLGGLQRRRQGAVDRCLDHRSLHTMIGPTGDAAANP